jgi:hypothetical protein
VKHKRLERHAGSGLREYSFSRWRLLVTVLVFAAVGGYLIIKSLATSPPPNISFGDLNADGKVDVLDLSSLLSAWAANNLAGDINGDGVVNNADLLILLSHYSQTTPVGAVNPPQPPASYNIPAGAISVSSVSSLNSALSGSSRDIVLEDGVYNNSTSILVTSHRLWARHPAGAVLHFGLQLGGNGSGGGAEVHGLKFDITDANTTFQSAAINIWGSAGPNSVITDSWIYAHGVLASGIMDRTTSGFKAQRLVLNDFTDYGVFFETYSPDYWTDNPAVVPVVSDIDVANVARPIPGSAGGQAEAGVWAGTNCLCSRIKVRNTGWMGLWLGGNANNGIYSDLDIDQIESSGVGVYLEHYSRSNVFKNFVIGGSTGGTGVRVGFNCEWADPAYAGTNPVPGQSIGACHFNTIQDGTIYSNYRGVQLEDAESTTISRVKFIGQSSAAIDDFMTSGSGYSTIWQSQANDFSGLPAGALQYSQAH